MKRSAFFQTALDGTLRIACQDRFETTVSHLEHDACIVRALQIGADLR